MSEQETRRLRKELKAANKGAQTNALINQSFANQIRELTRQRDAAVKALEQYADEKKWAVTDICASKSFFTKPGDGYDIAQAAIKDIGGMV